MCEWLSIVRVTDVQAIRWLLGALNEIDRPVSTRRAQAWVSRMEVVGLIERVNLGGPGGSIVWGTYEATGQSRPNIYRQTTRHEVEVAAVSARYINANNAWRRGERPARVGGHQADGVATGIRTQQLIEVDLTPKRAPRYASIFSASRRRLELDDGLSVTCLCNHASGRAVRTALKTLSIGQALAPRGTVRDMFNDRGAIRTGGGPLAEIPRSRDPRMKTLNVLLLHRARSAVSVVTTSAEPMVIFGWVKSRSCGDPPVSSRLGGPNG